MMNVRIINTNNNIGFKSNQGVLKIIGQNKRNLDIELLQVELYTIKNTPDFALAIRSLSDEWKKFLLKLTDPTGLIERFKEAGSDMKSAQEIFEKRTKCHAVLKEILNG